MENGTHPHPTTIQRAAAAADCLIRRGIPHAHRNDLIAVIYQALNQAETVIRQEERQRITAEWLTEVIPGEVIQLAAERVAAKAY
jgi:hypothetical protein